MNIQHHLKSVVLATTLAFSAGAMQTAVAYSNNQNYKIVNIANWDALNIRSGAGTGYRVINEIPANSSNITLTGNEKDVNGSTWVKIKWDGQIGWVNKRYLTIAEASVAPASNNTYVNYAQNNKAGSTHSHPANRCTRSISHTHAGPTGHSHRYSCKGNGRQQVASNQTAKPRTTKQQYYNPAPVAYNPPAPRTNTDIYGNYRRVAATTNNIGNHTHPANRCTRSISHSHAGAKAGHKHSYSCKGKGRQQQVTRQRTYYGGSLKHTHGKSQCVSAIAHSHNGGNKIHRHECPSSGRSSAAGGRHTHPANSLTRATTHSHPYQDRSHSHSYGRR
ncbi:MAG TPA: SH3 domain-containing protein [Leucothrix mucor]|nr:SH3 domain-containing protein [Leucothrix mucor]